MKNLEKIPRGKDRLDVKQRTEHISTQNDSVSVIESSFLRKLSVLLIRVYRSLVAVSGARFTTTFNIDRQNISERDLADSRILRRLRTTN